MKILERLNPTNTGSYNRPIAHALGLGAAVVYAALINKQVYYEQHIMIDEDGFFYSTIADLQESTSMGKCQQSNAIKVLTDAGLVEVCRRGMPAKRYFRVRDDVELLDKFLKQGKEIIAELNPIAQLDDNRPTCCTETEQQVVGFSDNKLAQNEPYLEWQSITNLKKKEKFYDKHYGEIALFKTAKSFYDSNLNGAKLTPKAWQRELDELKKSDEVDRAKVEKLGDDVAVMETLIYNVQRLTNYEEKQNEIQRKRSCELE